MCIVQAHVDRSPQQYMRETLGYNITLHIEYMRETLGYNITLIPFTIIPLTLQTSLVQPNELVFQND
jgi:hypothetical protein